MYNIKTIPKTTVHRYQCDSSMHSLAVSLLSLKCWCGEEDVEFDRHGPGTCDFKCAGDPSEMCGGIFAFTLYQYDSWTSRPDPLEDPDALGCFADNKRDRVLTAVTESDDMTPMVRLLNDVFFSSGNNGSFCPSSAMEKSTLLCVDFRFSMVASSGPLAVVTETLGDEMKRIWSIPMIVPLRTGAFRELATFP